MLLVVDSLDSSGVLLETSDASVDGFVTKLLRVVEYSVDDSLVVESLTVELLVVESLVVESSVVEYSVVESSVVESSVAECSVVESFVVESSVFESFVVKSSVVESSFNGNTVDFERVDISISAIPVLSVLSSVEDEVCLSVTDELSAPDVVDVVNSKSSIVLDNPLPSGSLPDPSGTIVFSAYIIKKI